ncbi:MFS transporter [Aspergillus aculeatinus CBS 121060]|uniref:MFS multidrug transporter n=1 Tax=Aspergillus aculeatinus CBS 121060 TaxID=1448322 RepID=A0ACD1HKQ4_9EURO|nr:MFS multidrug transporter [Aspergillus aculeatinus CBS 121060]RAH73977.1 MFS multidrug transporter [Aspergillus aculeatinus CBS 121060]
MAERNTTAHANAHAQTYSTSPEQSEQSEHRPSHSSASSTVVHDDVEKQNVDPSSEEGKDPNIVDWDGPDDPEYPPNWTELRKWTITIILGLMTVSVTFASSVFSAAAAVTAEQFGVSEEVMILGTSLFVLGYSFGPLAFGPLSELYGRKTPLFVGFFIFAIFQIPVAVAQNLQTIFVCRFFGGLFASAPLAIVGGMLADFFDPVERGIAMAVFAGSTFVGPVAGPIVGGFITMSYLGWRWTEYITAIMAFFFGALGFLVVPETFAPVLLQRRARRRRYATRNWALHARSEEEPVDLKNIAHRYLVRPIDMLFREPILLLITLYMGFIYGFLYLCFEAYPIAFQEMRGWNEGVGALPFVAVTCGVLVGCGIIITFTKTRFQAVLRREGHIVPEERLIPMMIGGVLLPAGMFWFGWTSNPSISWVPQAISGGFLGAGILLIFMQGLNYIIDCYGVNSNSAIAANCFFRSGLGAGFPMFALPMFHNLGVNWAMTLLGCLTAILFPVPILFYVFGKRIRSWSRFSPSEE